MAELRDIVQSMVNSGETEENIAAVIKRYNVLNPSTKEVKGATPQEDATVDVEDTASDSGDGSSESQEVAQETEEKFDWRNDESKTLKELKNLGFK